MNDMEDITLYKIIFRNQTMNKRFLKRNASILSTINKFLERNERTQTEKEIFPKKGDTYYFVDANCAIDNNVWDDDDFECELLYSNNLFKTKEGHDEYCPDFKPCFEGPGLRKNYVVYYDYILHKWRYDYFSKITNKHDVYFDSEESAQKMCDVLNNEEYRKMREAENE